MQMGMWDPYQNVSAGMKKKKKKIPMIDFQVFFIQMTLYTRNFGRQQKSPQTSSVRRGR